MKQRSFLSILCFVLITFGVASVSSQTCIQNRKYFTPNSTYDANRQLILASLPSNVSSQDDFHYYGSIGEDPNRIYAIGMCIPGANANDCSNCIKSVSDYLIPSCPNQTDAYYWALTPTLCLIRYSNVSFTGSAAFWEITPQYLVYNTADIITSNLTMFKTIWEDLISRMIMAASTSRSTPLSSDNHYKADVAALTKFQNIYALMQCTPDISSRDCDNCLRQSVIDYQSCCAKKTGGYVMRPICFFQWQLLVFSKAFDNYTSAPPPSLSPPPERRQPPPARNRAMAKDNSAGKLSTRSIAAIVVVVVAAAAVLIISVYLACRFCRKRKSYQEEEVELNQTGITTVRSLKYNFKTIEAATNNFSTKIGRGGFGDVFKGTLANGDEVAVKRLSSTSKQGDKEFKNEVVVVAKLQHNNLVRLLGFSVKGKEKILVYEFVRNRSLDSFLSDPTKQGQLGWTKRYNIITGITRGILYLHRDSRLKIIHRDLKAENILLDGDMNPKISDFGMARIFLINQNVADTQRPAGTFGYMPPEYINHGIYSMKSDVYSFGVLILEIICGKKNINFYTNTQNLVTYAWRLWRNGSPLDLVDSTIGDGYPIEEVTRCIHIAFLCVQEDPTNRPDLPTISMMLGTNTFPLPVPQPPGLLVPNQSTTSSIYHSCNYNFEVNHVSGTSVIS